MDDFEEILGRIISPAEGEEFDVNIYDDLRSAHTDRVSAGDSKVAALESALAESIGEIDRLKAHNYDLLMMIPKNSDDTGEGGDSEDGAVEVKDESIESMFFEEKGE